MEFSVKTFMDTEWHQQCEMWVRECQRRAMSSVHCDFLFSQTVDDALEALTHDCVGMAIEIAQSYGYETPSERQALRQWISNRP
jgi:hypothetical protein